MGSIFIFIIWGLNLAWDSLFYQVPPIDVESTAGEQPASVQVWHSQVPLYQGNIERSLRSPFGLKTFQLGRGMLSCGTWNFAILQERMQRYLMVSTFPYRQNNATIIRALLGPDLILRLLHICGSRLDRWLHLWAAAEVEKVQWLPLCSAFMIRRQVLLCSWAAFTWIIVLSCTDFESVLSPTLYI